MPDWVLYTKDISDEQLEAEWKSEPAKLGSMSMGLPDEGRLINGVEFPKGKDWVVVDPRRTYGTQETIDFTIAAIEEVVREFPETTPVRVNQIGREQGGWLRPHHSHQAGRDVDIGFYYKPGYGPGRCSLKERIRRMDVPRDWALVKALVTKTDLQFILVDRAIQKVLYDYALAHGEDKGWLDTLFHTPHHGLIQHARGHRDHFHARFYNARAEELGRRVTPLLAKRPDQNVAFHRVRRGDTLFALARKFDTTVQAIRRANQLRRNVLSVRQVLTIPLRGPCTHCPLPPPVVVPPRTLPPAKSVAQSGGAPLGQELRTRTAAK